MNFYAEAVCVSSSNHLSAYDSKTQSHNLWAIEGNETHKGLAPQQGHSIPTENGGSMNSLYIFLQAVGILRGVHGDHCTGLYISQDKKQNKKKTLLKTLRSIWTMIQQ